MMAKKKVQIKKNTFNADNYILILKGLVKLVEEARRFSARTVNAVMTAAYREIGRRIVEHEQRGKKRAQYGKELLKKLSDDLTGKFGRGFSERNLRQMRQFYLFLNREDHGLCPWMKREKTNSPKAKPEDTTGYARGSLYKPIRQTMSAESDKTRKQQTLSAELSQAMSSAFPLSWSSYVALLTWNCRHIDNPATKPLIRNVCGAEGYVCPEICTPIEIMEVTKNGK